ncbi:hypothetical protein KXS70_24785, partial [Salmonella enterica subsp. enterica serovar Weltevreden]|nr:hypothetical protein [Salmonella enterica subsp. enterica serovar Weltevreden]
GQWLPGAVEIPIHAWGQGLQLAVEGLWAFGLPSNPTILWFCDPLWILPTQPFYVSLTFKDPSNPTILWVFVL